MKHRHTESNLTKHQVLHWVNNTLKGNETKIQSLGNGVIYCMLMNHYIPNSIAHNKIILMPRNNMDNKANLKKVQDALASQNIKSITFDIFRVSQMSYLDNWQLICKLYRHFEELNKQSEKEVEKHNQQSESQTIATNTGQVQVQQQQHNMQSGIQNQMSFIIPKQATKSHQFSTGLLTPMKGLKYFQQSTKLRFEALRLMQQIKSIVKLQSQSDKAKVRILKKMLGLIQEQSQQQQQQMKQLFSDCKKKQEVITID